MADIKWPWVSRVSHENVVDHLNHLLQDGIRAHALTRTHLANAQQDFSELKEQLQEMSDNFALAKKLAAERAGEREEAHRAEHINLHAALDQTRAELRRTKRALARLQAPKAEHKASPAVQAALDKPKKRSQLLGKISGIKPTTKTVITLAPAVKQKLSNRPQGIASRASAGGYAAAAKMTPAQRSERSRRGARALWGKRIG